MRIVEINKDKGGKVQSVMEAYNEELRMNNPLQKLEPTASGGVKITLSREDEFGNSTDLKMIFEAQEFQLLRFDFTF